MALTIDLANFALPSKCSRFYNIYYSQKELKHWSRDVIGIWVLSNFDFKTQKYFMHLIVLNIFKYIFWDKCPQKFELCQND